MTKKMRMISIYLDKEIIKEIEEYTTQKYSPFNKVSTFIRYCITEKLQEIQQERNKKN